MGQTAIIAMSLVLALAGCKKAEQIKSLSASETPVQAEAQSTKSAKAVNGAETGIVFKQLSEVVTPGQTKVINGRTLELGKWPALLVAEMERRQPDKSIAYFTCTATLVGPRVLLTAAHCVDAGAGDEVTKTSLLMKGYSIGATCKMHGNYAAATVPEESTPRDSADYALCLLDEDVQSYPEFEKLQFESIDRDAAPTLTNPVLVTGYGCTSVKLNGAGKPIFGPTVRVVGGGDATISATPGSGADRNYLQTHSVAGKEAALCPGDSGGPLVTGATMKDQAHKRRVAGVNSSIAIINRDVKNLVSRFASLSTSDFRSFSDTWVENNGKPVFCGVNRKAGEWPCRA